MGDERDPDRRRGSSTTLIVVIALALLLGLVEVVAIQKFGRRPSAPAEAPVATPSQPAPVPAPLN